MENRHYTNETDESDVSARKSRKYNAGNLGFVAAASEKSRQPALEANQLHAPHKRQEHIGHMLVTAEVRPAAAVSEQKAATMSRVELLSLSETIMVNGSSLRQIFESHLIGEHGLRRLIAEYARGGDLKKALRQEVIEREIDFERDPAMRDLPLQAAAPLSGSGKAALNTLLKQAAASIPAAQEEAAFFKARARYDAVQQSQRQKQRRAIDIAMTAAITVLVVVVIFLFIRGN